MSAMFYAALRVLYVASLVAGASAAGFANRAALQAAVDNCLDAEPEGDCDCSSASVDCGAAGSLPISQWDTSRVSDMNGLFKNQGSFNANISAWDVSGVCLLYTSPSPRDRTRSRMPSSA